jgi:hypothetical protein
VNLRQGWYYYCIVDFSNASKLDGGVLNLNSQPPPPLNLMLFFVSFAPTFFFFLTLFAPTFHLTKNQKIIILLLLKLLAV